MRILITTLLLVGLCGCGGDEQGSSEAPAAAAPGKYATPEAVLAEVERLLSRKPPDTRGFYDLVYAENELPKRIMRSNAMFVAGQIKSEALYEQFGKWTWIEDPFPVWPIDEMRIIEKSDARATAECVGYPRSEPFERPVAREVMHLVRIDDRWWVSGYSWEYVEESKWDAALRTLERQEASIERYRQKAERFAELVRSGRFATFEEANEAWTEFLLSDE